MDATLFDNCSLTLSCTVLNSATSSAEAHSVAMVTTANYVCQGKKESVQVNCSCGLCLEHSQPTQV